MALKLENKENVSKVKSLLPRKKRCPNFKCQKKWNNCTTKHRPIIKENTFTKKHKCKFC